MKNVIRHDNNFSMSKEIRCPTHHGDNFTSNKSVLPVMVTFANENEGLRGGCDNTFTTGETMRGVIHHDGDFKMKK